jgi:hypothetical protein
MKQRDRCKGRKESLGKETDVLDPDEHFDVIALMLDKGNNKITELRTILQRESQNS